MAALDPSPIPPGLNRVNWSAQICEGTALLITLVFMVWNGLVPTNIFWHSGGPEHIQHYLDDFTDLFASYPAAKLKVEQLNLVTKQFFKLLKLLIVWFHEKRIPKFYRILLTNWIILVKEREQ